MLVRIFLQQNLYNAFVKYVHLDSELSIRSWDTRTHDACLYVSEKNNYVLAFKPTIISDVLQF